MPEAGEGGPGYTRGEVGALIAPLFGMAAEDVHHVMVVVHGPNGALGYFDTEQPPLGSDEDEGLVALRFCANLSGSIAEILRAAVTDPV